MTRTKALERAVALAIIAAIALLTRLVGIGNHSLWFDEALEYERAAQSVTAVLQARSIDQDPPLFALMLHAWLEVGADATWLRLPSALLGAATAFVVGGWAWRRLGAATGAVSGLLVAVAPVLVYYGQEVNQYAAMVFLSVSSVALYERVVERGRRADWLAYSVLSVVALATHYGMVFPLAVLGLGLLRHVVRSGDRRIVGRFLVYLLMLVALVLVLWWLGLGKGLGVPHLQRRLGGTHLEKEIDYIRDVGWREVLVFYLLPFSGGPALHLVRVLSVAALAGAILLWRAGASGRRAVAVFVVGLTLTYGTSLMGWYPLGYRYGLFAAPWMVVAVGAVPAAIWSRSRPAGLALAVAAVLAFVAFLPVRAEANRWLHVPREDLEPVSDYVRSGRAPGDAVYVYYGALPALSYYWRDEVIPVTAGRYPVGGSWWREIERARAAAEIHGRVWIVLSHEAPGDGTALLRGLLSPTSGARGLRLTDSVRALGAAAYALEP